ncbi:hypothetical protein HCN51_24490 [Nonomuraea sp. FMUSA5-5]|uniref:Uncharacterized protein n=1 Tax=Nonomuraea composti TaxID=2720023 RepID=A0ABX1B566_9ACTN|nr:hypothetical protein [Nonomuraea sp. FMUSA5-5]NJP92576.1 hypothetical protein [Nonomuraea sp. FMUSA5-5]
MRTGKALGLADSTPDQVLLAHGHRLCAVYTRDDPDELARVDAAEGVDVRELYGLLAPICPAAGATVEADMAAADREFAESDAKERRKCAATPRHRPLIAPAKAVRLEDPRWPGTGMELYASGTGAGPDDGVPGQSVKGRLRPSRRPDVLPGEYGRHGAARPVARRPHGALPHPRPLRLVPRQRRETGQSAAADHGVPGTGRRARHLPQAAARTLTETRGVRASYERPQAAGYDH